MQYSTLLVFIALIIFSSLTEIYESFCIAWKREKIIENILMFTNMKFFAPLPSLKRLSLDAADHIS